MSSGGAWWVKAWEALLQGWGISVAEARSNRAYRVKSLEVIPGGMDVAIHDRDAGACTVEVRVPTLRDEQWAQIGEAINSQPLVSSQLLSGTLPPEIEGIFREVGAHLLPVSPKEIVTTCSVCGKQKCRHLPLVFSLFAEMLENDPGLLFTLRGRDLQLFLREVRDARASGAASHSAAANGAAALPKPANLAAPDGITGTESASSKEPATDRNTATDTPAGEDPSTPDAENREPQTSPLAAEIDTYWGNRALMRQFHHHIAPPTVELSLLRRLGPISASDDSMIVYEQLVALYRRITEEALALAYASDDPDA